MIVPPDNRTSIDLVVQVSSLMEWNALVALLPPTTTVEQTPLGAMAHHSWTHGPNLVRGVLFHGGVGKIMAAAAAQYAVLVWRPRSLVLIGTCGAVSPDMHELDLVCATQTVVHDITIEAVVRVLTTVLPSHWQDLPSPYPLHRGMIVSGDANVTAGSVDGLRTRFPALAADWESGAVAKICALNDVPCIVLKGISDIPHGTAEEQFNSYRSNTPPIMRRCWEVLERWIAHGLVATT